MMMILREGKASVTFHGVAAYFSEEEWKLLPQWQKELYKNVMKEIHQALISLGHSIINRDTILQIRKREDLHFFNSSYSGRRDDINEPMSSASYSSATPDIFLRTEQEENLYKENQCASKEAKFITGSDTGGQSDSSYSFRTKEEQDPCPIDKYDNEEKGSSNTSKSNDPVITSVFSLSLEHEEETYSQKRFQPEEIKSGDATKRRYEDFVKPDLNVAASGKVKIETFPSIQKKADSNNSLWSRNNHEFGRKMPTYFKDCFTDAIHSNLHQTKPKLETSETFHKCEYESNLRNVGILSWVPDTPSMWRPFKCTECEAYFSLSEDLFRHEQTHPQQASYKCTECNKSYVLKEDLAAHQRIHNVIRMKSVMQLQGSNIEGNTTNYTHQCTHCAKSFCLKESLNIHLRKHIDTKPFKCSLCDKSFNQKVIFLRHQRTHIGERPYICSACGINFTHKLGLLVHQKRRLCKKAFPFPVYTKCFVLLGERVSPEVINDGAVQKNNYITREPYQCRECGGGFSRKV
ncbi:zinc finger protein 777-like isoform X3 [Pleurodeles waltl]|uniref:zinc finger protein 777-like isoform X3 n=1 Tax=Pleurodeles waltl TaxID=8319 RepID=UPI003709A862